MAGKDLAQSRLLVDLAQRRVGAPAQVTVERHPEGRVEAAQEGFPFVDRQVGGAQVVAIDVIEEPMRVVVRMGIMVAGLDITIDVSGGEERGEVLERDRGAILPDLAAYFTFDFQKEPVARFVVVVAAHAKLSSHLNTGFLFMIISQGGCIEVEAAHGVAALLEAQAMPVEIEISKDDLRESKRQE